MLRLGNEKDVVVAGAQPQNPQPTPAQHNHDDKNKHRNKKSKSLVSKCHLVHSVMKFKKVFNLLSIDQHTEKPKGNPKGKPKQKPKAKPMPMSINTAKNNVTKCEVGSALVIYGLLVFFVAVGLFGKQLHWGNKSIYFGLYYALEIVSIVIFLTFLLQSFLLDAFAESVKRAGDKLAPWPASDRKRGDKNNNNNNNNNAKILLLNDNLDKLKRNPENRCVKCKKVIFGLYHIEWTRLSLIVVGTLVYYLMCIIMFVAYGRTYNGDDRMQFGLFWLKLLSNTLAPICLYTYGDAKGIAKPVAERMVARARKVSVSVTTHLSLSKTIIATTSSVFQYNCTRIWIYCVCILKFLIYITSPLLYFSVLVDHSNIIDDYSIEIDSLIHLNNQVVIKWICVVLRQFTGIVFIYTIFFGLQNEYQYYYEPPSLSIFGRMIMKPFNIIAGGVLLFVDIMFTLNCNILSVDASFVFEIIWCVGYFIIICSILLMLCSAIKTARQLGEDFADHQSSTWTRPTPILLTFEGGFILILNTIFVFAICIYYNVDQHDVWNQCSNDYSSRKYLFIVLRQFLILGFNIGILLVTESFRPITQSPPAKRYVYVYFNNAVCVLFVNHRR